MNNPAAADRICGHLPLRCNITYVFETVELPLHRTCSGNRSQIKMHSSKPCRDEMKSTTQPCFLFTPSAPKTSVFGDIIYDTIVSSYSCLNSPGMTRLGQICENVRTKCKVKHNSLAEFHIQLSLLEIPGRIQLSCVFLIEHLCFFHLQPLSVSLPLLLHFSTPPRPPLILPSLPSPPVIPTFVPRANLPGISIIASRNHIGLQSLIPLSWSEGH